MQELIDIAIEEILNVLIERGKGKMYTTIKGLKQELEVIHYEV